MSSTTRLCLPPMLALPFLTPDTPALLLCFLSFSHQVRGRGAARAALLHCCRRGNQVGRGGHPRWAGWATWESNCSLCAMRLVDLCSAPGSGCCFQLGDLLAQSFFAQAPWAWMTLFGTLCFDPPPLDDWLAPGKSWDDPPPPLTAASEPGHGRGRRGKFIGACMGRLLAVAAGALSG